ncbi:hypothetical protein GGX14DRAFT_601973 [Mycena pura]|uniref:Uncharacterized protein n=1 Tax=Mycena pura TaxID=153505 RepID=A0AAD6YEJ9_9AGAR|nr:hypothetical protein GGX14DRAFT_601973 [Mycena pura]
MTRYENGQFKIPLPAKSRPENPLRASTFDDATEKSSDPSSMNVDDEQSFTSSKVQKSAQKQDKGLLRSLLRTDQFSFLSGSSDAAMQACHVLNAIRSSKKGVERAAIKKFKESIELFATALWFNEGRDFKLEGRLLVDEHYRWDVYGIYAFSPSYGSLHLILEELTRCNSEWAKRAASNADATRDLPDSLTVDMYEWRIVILHPEDFFPRGQRVKVLHPNKRILRTSMEIPEEPLSSDWVDCTVRTLPDEPPLLVHGATPLTPKLSLTLRKDGERLSLFAMLVNLHWKLEAYMTEAAPLSNRKLRQMHGTTTALMAQIFFRPPHTTIPIPLPVPVKVKDPRNISTSTSHTPSSSANKFSTVTPTEGTFSNTPTEGTFSKKTRSGGNRDTNMESPDSLPVPPEPEFINGLTSTECETLFDRLSNPTGGADSADAFMQLLCGAKGFPDFKAPPTRWVREHGWESGSGSESGSESESESAASDDAESVGA